MFTKVIFCVELLKIKTVLRFVKYKSLISKSCRDT